MTAWMQRLLVALQRQHVVGLALDDLLGDRLLRPHRVDGDDRPLMSTSLNSSGIAVISFDFSAQATWPSDRPNSLAQTLTECNAPRPFWSWLRRWSCRRPPGWVGRRRLVLGRLGSQRFNQSAKQA